MTKQINEKFQLINEVKDLHKSCFMKGSKMSFTYTIDRLEPYQNEASYKGISRVLQGFEVVLLCCLTQYVIELKGIPLSLDHDGLTALFMIEPLIDNNKEQIEENVLDISSSLTEKMKSWSTYLLRSIMPIETKRYWFNGDVKNY